jgi:hypothetical protein
MIFLFTTYYAMSSPQPSVPHLYKNSPSANVQSQPSPSIPKPHPICQIVAYIRAQLFSATYTKRDPDIIITEIIKYPQFPELVAFAYGIIDLRILDAVLPCLVKLHNCVRCRLVSSYITEIIRDQQGDAMTLDFARLYVKRSKHAEFHKKCCNYVAKKGNLFEAFKYALAPNLA